MVEGFVADIFGSSPEGKRAVCVVCHRRRAAGSMVVPVCTSCAEPAHYLDAQKDMADLEDREKRGMRRDAPQDYISRDYD